MTKNLFMRHVGFCGISNLAQTDNVNRIVLDFVAQERGREVRIREKKRLFILKFGTVIACYFFKQLLYQ